MINYTPRLFVVVGSPASGKDELIKAVIALGKLHANIVAKHTERAWKWDDEEEMICKKVPNEMGVLEINPNYDLDGCNIIYENYGTHYGIKTKDIWNGLQEGVHQVIVVSNVTALNQLKQEFGDLAIFLYVYSEVTKEQYMENEYKKMIMKSEMQDEVDDYLKKREENFDMAWKLYEENFMLFNHVFIYINSEEDLFDQIFRLFRFYERRTT